MNQLVNIPIMACRTHAGKGSLEALRAWELWNDMVCLPVNSLPPLFLVAKERKWHSYQMIL